MPKPLTIEQLMEKVEMIPIAGCWLWKGAFKKTGLPYGWLQHKGKLTNAHRIFWELFNGPIENPKIYVLHRCDNPACVNPEHLFLGDHAANMADRQEKGRTKNGISYGKKRAWSKLSESNVLEIRTMISEGVTQREIAGLLNISQSTVSAIKTGVIWNV